MCQQKELKNWDAAKLSGTLRKMVNEGILEKSYQNNMAYFDFARR